MSDGPDPITKVGAVSSAALLGTGLAMILTGGTAAIPLIAAGVVTGGLTAWTAKK
jgi:uncharacterized membrane protein (DUF441 family)